MCWHFPRATRISANLFWSDFVPLYSAYGLRRQNEKKGSKGRIWEVHPKSRGEKKVLPAYATAVYFFFLSMQIYLQKVITENQKLR